MSTDRLNELRRICDAYGAEPARWPADKREEFGAFFMSDEASELRAEAEALDGFLNAATAPRMTEDLTRRITAAYVPPAQQSLSVMDWFRALAPFARFKGMRLVPAGALAGLGAIGLASGIVTASAQQSLTPEGEALAYFETDIALASLDEEEAATWDAD